MAQQINQRTVPVGGDEPKRAWFDEYARSDRGILEFATLAAANTWATDPANAEYAVDSRHAWVDAENAVYVRSSGAWQVLWRASTHVAETITPDLTAPLSGSLVLERRAGAVHADFAATLGTTASGATVATIPEGWRPLEQKSIVLAGNGADISNALLLISSTSGAVTINYYGSPATSRILRGNSSWAL